MLYYAKIMYGCKPILYNVRWSSKRADGLLPTMIGVDDNVLSLLKASAKIRLANEDATVVLAADPIPIMPRRAYVTGAMQSFCALFYMLDAKSMP